MRSPTYKLVFKNLGGDDKAAKGSSLTIELKNNIIKDDEKRKHV